MPPKISKDTATHLAYPAMMSSGDFSYTLEVVMSMQSTIGKLTEAVDGLKTQSKSFGEKLELLARSLSEKVESVAKSHGEKLESVARSQNDKLESMAKSHGDKLESLAKSQSEKVETLAKSHGEKLEQISKDIHAAKVVLWIVGGGIAIATTFAGIFLKCILDYLVLRG